MGLRRAGVMVASSARSAALVLSPHPDDELLGCPAHLFALRDAGWRIVNLALSLGEADQQARRQRELEQACRLAGFELIVGPPELRPPAPGAGQAALQQAAERVLELARSLAAALLVAPSPHDDHPAHERTGRLAVAAARAGAAPRLWLWGLWADLACPNSLCVFDEGRLEEIDRALSAHTGELARNDYGRLLRARAEAAAVLLPERVFGHGSAGLPADMLAEAVCDLTIGATGELLLAAPATFDACSFQSAHQADKAAIAGWLDDPSPRQASGGWA
jgi:LmbE family N-acetylglucosaminyl deacetylase